MSDIADRFRPKLGSDWPEPLPAMFDAILEEDAHDPERVVGHVLEAWSADPKVDEAVREALRHDALAFILDDHHGCEWGKTHFGPYGSMRTESGKIVTSPPRERLSKAAIEHWRERAEQVEHHIACARYSDMAWDFAPLVGLARRREDAIQAIDSYIGQCVMSGSELHQERCLRRAHSIARAVGDSQRAANVRTSLLELCCVTENEACDRLRFLACDLFLLDKKSDATDKERCTLIEWMEDGLERCVEAGDPFDGERFAKRLDLHYRQQGNSEGRKREAQKFGGLLESWAAKGNGMLAMHNY